ncbi:MAG TPA: hypothetical protein VI566_02365 [Xanthomonadales bacterium]|nr:hypothetical protein [Xanthomonadales bacterium]
MITKQFCRVPAVHASLTLALLLFASAPVLAADTGSSSEWEYLADIYFWGANMEIKTTGGQEVDLPFHQILDALDFAFMTEVGARNDKWSVMTDVIYMNLSQKNNLRDATLPDGSAVTVNDKVDMKSWIVTPTVGYVVHSSEDDRVEVLAGLRYFWVNMGIEIDVNDTEVFNKSAAEGFWDGIIGLRANINVSQSWYLPMYFDVGTGDSDLTWQAYAGLGYHFSRFDAMLTYRYLDYEFDHTVTSDLVVKGPLLGAVFKF